MRTRSDIASLSRVFTNRSAPWSPMLRIFQRGIFNSIHIRERLQHGSLYATVAPASSGPRACAEDYLRTIRCGWNRRLENWVFSIARNRPIGTISSLFAIECQVGKLAFDRPI